MSVGRFLKEGFVFISGTVLYELVLAHISY